MFLSTRCFYKSIKTQRLKINGVMVTNIDIGYNLSTFDFDLKN